MQWSNHDATIGRMRAQVNYMLRHTEVRLREAMEYSPVTLVQGPRQCGKTTLVQAVCQPAGYDYRTFDDEGSRRAVEADPTGFINGLPERVILDEVQRVPKLFSAIKLAVDRNRQARRFVLTGSVKVLQVPELTDSLADYMTIIRLHPLAQTELGGVSPEFLDALFSADFKMRQGEPTGAPLLSRIVAGGYPAALQRTDERRRRAWYSDYIETLTLRDAPDLAAIRLPEILSRLLALAAAQTAQLVNVSNLASSFQLSRNTIEDYLALLEKMFLLERTPAWRNNRLKRLVKTPKLHLGDTGVACALMKLNSAALAHDGPLLGHVLETFVFQELRRQASGYRQPHNFSHFRDKDKAKVDIVIQRGATALAGVEVKAAATVSDADLRGLRKLKAATGERFAAGALLYNGDHCLSFGSGIYAVPLSVLWNKGRFSRSPVMEWSSGETARGGENPKRRTNQTSDPEKIWEKRND